MKHVAILLALFAGPLSLACGGNSPPTPAPVLVPARLDMHQYGRAGLVLFTVEKAKGQLDQITTQRFSEAVLAAQPGIEVLEVGSADSVRRRVGEADYGAATARALGAAYNVPVVFVGHLKMSSITPQGGLSGLLQGHVDATVSAELSVALIATGSGGTIWRSSGVASRKIGGLSLAGGEPYVSAKDPNKAYSALVYDLVDYVTRDLRPSWQ